MVKVNEIWKTIIEFPRYEASNLGKVRNIKTGRVLKPSACSGYRKVGLALGSKTYTRKVSRLVAITFLDNPNNLAVVNHINNNSQDDRVSNLEWATTRENACHAKRSNKVYSQYIGVTTNVSKKSPWRSTIFFNGKLKTIGKFKTEIEAYSARVDFENQHGIVNKYLKLQSDGNNSK